MSKKKDPGIYLMKNNRNGKVYIGQSMYLDWRLSLHMYMLRKGNHKNAEMQKDYDSDNRYFSFEVIERCPEDRLDDLEKKYIAAYNADSPDFGYNIEPGGFHDRKMSEKTKKKLSERFSGGRASFLGKKHTAESLEKMSKAHKGVRPSAETRAKMSEAQKNRPPASEHTRKLISEAKSGVNHHYYGKHLSEEHRRKISETEKGAGNPMYGKKQTDHAKRIIAIKQYAPVVCIETGILYESMESASRKTGISRPSIGQVCRGNHKKAGGLHWRYATESESETLKNELLLLENEDAILITEI